MALCLGKIVLVVGDHEQVSLSALGQDLGIIQNLIFEHLQGIPNSHLYHGQISIYDLARQSFAGTTCLVEHFRCVPEIIQFSNKISYEGRIKPLRDTSNVFLRPHTIPYRVQGASRDAKVNPEEGDRRWLAWRVGNFRFKRIFVQSDAWVRKASAASSHKLGKPAVRWPE
jgi:superfamily I DNA and/or RNA helicase